MILIDANQIMISNLFAMYGKKLDDLTIDKVRYAVLKGIMYYNHRFKDEYGQVVLCYDTGNYWRTNQFPYYKSNRKKKQDKDSIDWNKIYGLFSIVKEEIDENFPFVSIEVPKLEADDIIAVLCQTNYGKEKIIIISSDKDFQQLQRHENVEQYSPAHKEMLECKDPEEHLIEHIIRGDPSDGIPNALSDGDTFVISGKKQKIMSAKRFNKLLDLVKSGKIYDSKYSENFCRNEQLIDLECIPRDYQNTIHRSFRKAVNFNDSVGSSKMMDYLISNKLNGLLEELDKFQQKLNI